MCGGQWNSAWRWFRRAADQNYAIAQAEVGDVYSEGRGVSEDFEEAIQWYRKAGEQNLPGAQMSLGNMYFSGQGVPQDFSAAFE